MVDRLADVKFEVRRNLVVAASSRVQLPPDITQPLGEPAFDVHVDVFQVLAELHLAALNLAADLLEFLDDLVAFGFRNQPDLREHPRVSLRAGDVAIRQPRIKTDRLGEFLNPLIGRFLESTTPRFFHDHSPLLTFWLRGLCAEDRSPESIRCGPRLQPAHWKCPRE